jgi:selenocysteine-specific elongation factor
MQERLAPLRTSDLLQACRAYIEVQPQFAAALEEIYQGVNAQEHEVAALLSQDPDILPLPDAQHPEAYSVITKWQRLTAEVDRILANFHQRTPLAQGMEMESVRSQLSFAFSPKLFRAVVDKLAAEAIVVREESSLRLASHSVTLNEAEQAAATHLQQVLDDGGLTPAEMKDLEGTLSLPRKQLADLLGILESQQKIVKVTTDVYIGMPALEKARTVLIEQLSRQGDISAATFRDMLGISRKTAIPLLEYFDRIGLTLRVGDVRKLRKT